jgi:branched-chain amino acid transport system substrate-binding protein
MKLRLSRFLMAAGFALAGSAVAADPGVTNDTVVIGQSCALTGPLAEFGRDVVAGTQAYLAQVNARGGVHGRQIKIVTLDDGYASQRTSENVKRLIEVERVFLLYNIMGTPNNSAILPLIEQSRIPHVAPFTGADNVRVPANPLIFNVRASYVNEAEKIVEHMATVGVNRIGVVYQNNAFGKAGLAGIENAMAKRGLKVIVSASVENDASDSAKAVQAIAKADPVAVAVMTAGKPSFEFIKGYNAAHKGTPLYALSVLGTQSTVNALGADGVGVAVAQVVPFPWNSTIPIVNEYQKAMAKAGHKELSFLSLEAYINIKVTVEALKRAGKNLTRERFITAMESMRDVDLGGYVVDYGPVQRQGSRYVELTMIGRTGRFVK